MFGVHVEEEGMALRGTFLVNPEGVVKTAEIHDNSIARDMIETLRKLKAAQYVAKNPGQVETYQKNPKVIGWFTGQVMKASGGKANPQVVGEILKAKLPPVA